MGKIQITLRNTISASGTGYYAHYGPRHCVDHVTGDRVWILDNGDNNIYVWTQQGEDVAPTLVATIGGYAGVTGPYSSDQDASGALHLIGDYGGGICYSRLTFTRSGGHITGASSTSPFYLPSMTASLGGTPWGCSVAVIPNGSSVERVVIARIDGNDNNQYCAAVIHGPTNAAADSDFVSLSGTAETWTKFPTQTASANVNAPYCFGVVLVRYGSAGNFFVAAGAASRGDVGDYSCSLVGYRATTSGANWTVDTANPCAMASETDETFVGGAYRDASGNAYVSWTQRVGSGVVTVGISRIAADGTFTASWQSTTTTHGGEQRTYPVVCSDGTVILLIDPGDTGSSDTFTEVQVLSEGVWYSYWGASRRTQTMAWNTSGSQGISDGLLFSISSGAYPAPRWIGSVYLREAVAQNVYYDNYSAPVYSTTGTISPTYATAVPSNGDMYACIVGQKSANTTGGTITFPAGWTKQGEILGAGGYGAVPAVDTGNVDIAIATKDSVSGSESGSISVTLGSFNSAWAMMVRCAKGGDGEWDYAATTGSDTTGGAALSVTYGTAIDLAPGDLLVVAWVIPTDVTTPNQFTAQSITASGITFSEFAALAEPDSSGGNDIGGWVGYVRVLSGTGTVVPTVTATASGTTTNVRGGSVLLRLRELASGGPSITHIEGGAYCQVRVIGPTVGIVPAQLTGLDPSYSHARSIGASAGSTLAAMGSRGSARALASPAGLAGATAPATVTGRWQGGTAGLVASTQAGSFHTQAQPSASPSATSAQPGERQARSTHATIGAIQGSSAQAGRLRSNSNQSGDVTSQATSLRRQRVYSISLGTLSLAYSGTEPTAPRSRIHGATAGASRAIDSGATQLRSAGTPAGLLAGLSGASHHLRAHPTSQGTLAVVYYGTEPTALGYRSIGATLGFASGSDSGTAAARSLACQSGSVRGSGISTDARRAYPPAIVTLTGIQATWDAQRSAHATVASVFGADASGRAKRAHGPTLGSVSYGPTGIEYGYVSARSCGPSAGGVIAALAGYEHEHTVGPTLFVQPIPPAALSRIRAYASTGLLYSSFAEVTCS